MVRIYYWYNNTNKTFVCRRVWYWLVGRKSSGGRGNPPVTPLPIHILHYTHTHTRHRDRNLVGPPAKLRALSCELVALRSRAIPPFFRLFEGGWGERVSYSAGKLAGKPLGLFSLSRPNGSSDTCVRDGWRWKLYATFPKGCVTPYECC